MKLSIIIPAYNAAQFIGRCLDSVLSQDIAADEYEIIVVNDGSTDDTKEVVERYVETNNNIRLICQENGGSSVARNRGIKEARGRYIWFVDADDYAEKNSIKEILDKAYANSVDIIFFVLQLIQLDGSVTKTCFQNVTKETVMSGATALREGYYPCSACCELFSRVYLISQHLEFYPKIYHQDVQLTYRAVAKASKIVFTDYAPYIYEKREGSVSTSVNVQKVQKNIIDDIIVAQSFFEFSKQFVGNDEVCQIIRRRAFSIVFSTAHRLFQNKKAYSENGIYDAVMKFLKENDLYPLKGPFNSFKQKLYCKLILNNFL